MIKQQSTAIYLAVAKFDSLTIGSTSTIVYGVPPSSELDFVKAVAMFAFVIAIVALALVVNKKG
jgi:hypothetical protein